MKGKEGAFAVVLAAILIGVVALAGLPLLTGSAPMSAPSAEAGQRNQTGGGSSSRLVVTNSSTYLVTTMSSSTYTISYFPCSSPEAGFPDTSQVVVNHTVMCMSGGRSVDSDGRVDFMNGSVVDLHVNMTGSAMQGALYGYDAVVVTNGTRVVFNASGVIATIYPYLGEEVFANGTVTTFAPCLYPVGTNVEGSSDSANGTAAFTYANGWTVTFYPDGTCSGTRSG